jgi:hypothetical protein
MTLVTIDRIARLPLVVCSLLVWIGGALSRPRVFGVLVVFIAEALDDLAEKYGEQAQEPGVKKSSPRGPAPER